MTGPGGILHRSAARYGDKTALVCAGRGFSYGELDEAASRVSSGLRRLGVAPGDRVSLYAPNRWEWAVAYHGILRAGAVVNPINVMLTAEEVAYILNDCGAAVIFASGDKAADLIDLRATVPGLRHVVSFDGGCSGASDFADLLAGPAEGEAPVPVDPMALSTIAYTSGTTGYPKGAMQSHRSVLLNCALTASMHVRTVQDVVVTALPLPHVYGNVVVNSTFLAGGTVVLMERFAADEALRLIDTNQATMFEGVPTMYAMMIASPEYEQAQLSSLLRCTVGGQTIAHSVVEEWERRTGAPLLELWGMTELSGLGTTHALHAGGVAGSIGVALPGIEVRVASLDDPTATAPPGEPGELMVRGPLVMLGYHGHPEATAEAIDADGWLHTGDIAYADENGYFYVVDRRKDMILSGGYNVYPAEIERVIAGHPAVAMVGVGGIPDPIKGEVPRAYVVLRRGTQVTEAELNDHCRRSLAPYKLPRSIAFVPDLPKTSSGKIMRRELHKLD